MLIIEDDDDEVEDDDRPELISASPMEQYMSSHRHRHRLQPTINDQK